MSEIKNSLEAHASTSSTRNRQSFWVLSVLALLVVLGSANLIAASPQTVENKASLNVAADSTQDIKDEVPAIDINQESYESVTAAPQSCFVQCQQSYVQCLSNNPGPAMFCDDLYEACIEGCL